MFLVEDLLAGIWIPGSLLLREERVQLLVAVVADIEAVGRDLAGGEQGGVITIIGPGVFKLRQVVVPGLRTCRPGRRVLAQEWAKERTGRVVLNIELDTDGLEVLLQDQFVIGTPQVIRRGRIIEAQHLVALVTDAIGIFGRPTSLVKQGVGSCRVILRTGSIGLVAGNHTRGMIR